MSDIDNIPKAAQELSAAAQTLIGQGEHQQAYETLQQALEVIGDSYTDPNAYADDTQMRVLAAGYQEREGKLDNASQALLVIVEDRLRLLEAKRARQ